MEMWTLSAACNAGEGELLATHLGCFELFQLERGITAADLVDFIMAHKCEGQRSTA